MVLTIVLRQYGPIDTQIVFMRPIYYVCTDVNFRKKIYPKSSQRTQGGTLNALTNVR